MLKKKKLNLINLYFYKKPLKKGLKYFKTKHIITINYYYLANIFNKYFALI